MFPHGHSQVALADQHTDQRTDWYTSQLAGTSFGSAYDRANWSLNTSQTSVNPAYQSLLHLRDGAPARTPLYPAKQAIPVSKPSTTSTTKTPPRKPLTPEKKAKPAWTPNGPNKNHVVYVRNNPLYQSRPETAAKPAAAYKAPASKTLQKAADVLPTSDGLQAREEGRWSALSEQLSTATLPPLPRAQSPVDLRYLLEQLQKSGLQLSPESLALHTIRGAESDLKVSLPSSHGLNAAVLDQQKALTANSTKLGQCLANAIEQQKCNGPVQGHQQSAAYSQGQDYGYDPTQSHKREQVLTIKGHPCAMSPGTAGVAMYSTMQLTPNYSFDHPPARQPATMPAPLSPPIQHLAGGPSPPSTPPQPVRPPSPSSAHSSCTVATQTSADASNQQAPTASLYAASIALSQHVSTSCIADPPNQQHNSMWRAGHAMINPQAPEPGKPSYANDVTTQRDVADCAMQWQQGAVVLGEPRSFPASANLPRYGLSGVAAQYKDPVEMPGHWQPSVVPSKPPVSNSPDVRMNSLATADVVISSPDGRLNSLARPELSPICPAAQLVCQRTVSGEVGMPPKVLEDDLGLPLTASWDVFTGLPLTASAQGAPAAARRPLRGLRRRLSRALFGVWQVSAVVLGGAVGAVVVHMVSRGAEAASESGVCLAPPALPPSQPRQQTTRLSN